jgi:UDP-N-acetylglucosamine:LPS N-acetylglucosamine transferase
VTALQNSDKKIVLIRGTRKPAGIMPANFRIIDFCQPTELAHWLHCADTIICRSGYSTLMDLHTLHKKKIILIPTPGQSEQEYLAFYWKEKFEAVCLLQKQIGKELSLLLKTH